MKLCKQCGSAFSPRLPNKHVFCCKKCADAWSLAHAKYNRPSATCGHCGQEFKPKAIDRVAFCSRECAFASKTEASIERLGRLHLKRLWQSLRVCEICGRGYRALGSNQRLCTSSECRREDSRRRALTYGDGCRLCGGHKVKVGRYFSQYCEQCRRDVSKVAKKRAKRAREVKCSTPSRDYLTALRNKLARTNGQCRLCGFALSASCNVNHDRRVEFDHKIPLSLNGPDKIDNIQAICRKCNGLKAAFVATDVVIGHWIKAARNKHMAECA